MSDTILVALIGAFATVMTALFQIFMSSKQAASGGRSTKNRIKGLVWTVVLLLAAAGGGFAYSEYLVLTQDAPAQALRDRIGHTLLAANAMTPAVTPAASAASPAPSAAQLPTPSVANPGRIDARDGIAASVSLPACKGEPAGSHACSEQTAMNVALCAPIPANARVTEVLLYSRPDSSPLPWRDHLVSIGQDVGGGRFVDAHFERSEGEQLKDVCQKFAHWNGDIGRSVRIVVHFDFQSPAAAPTAQGTAPPPAALKPAG